MEYFTYGMSHCSELESNQVLVPNCKVVPRLSTILNRQEN
jgi:hypothetical protein